MTNRFTDESITYSLFNLFSGKRSCSGEAFVMLQIFIFLTTIVKNFKIVASNAPANSSTDFLIAEKLKLTFTPRTEN